MSRFVSTSMQAVSSLSVVAYRMLADIGVTSSTLYACTGNQYLYAMGNTYSPVGPLGGIQPLEEETDNFPRDVRMQLCAIDSANLYEPMRESMFNRNVTIYRSFLNANDFTQVSTPEIMWKGKIAEVNVHFDPQGAYYELRAESILKRTAKVQYFNRETFRAVDSSDTFGDHVNQIPLFKSQWGQNATSFTQVAAGPGTIYGPPRGNTTYYK